MSMQPIVVDQIVKTYRAKKEVVQALAAVSISVDHGRSLASSARMGQGKPRFFGF